jgi:hypothetical protein
MSTKFANEAHRSEVNRPRAGSQFPTWFLLPKATKTRGALLHGRGCPKKGDEPEHTPNQMFS